MRVEMINLLGELEVWKDWKDFLDGKEADEIIADEKIIKLNIKNNPE